MPLKTLSVNFVFSITNFQIFLHFSLLKSLYVSPYQIGASFTGVFHAKSMFYFFITFPYRVFAIEGGTTQGNAWDDISFASGIVAPTSSLPHGLHSLSTNIANHCKVKFLFVQHREFSVNKPCFGSKNVLKSIFFGVFFIYSQLSIKTKYLVALLM